MRLHIRIQPRSSKEGVLKLGEYEYKIYVHEPAVDGKANKRLVEILADYFGKKKRNVHIAQGVKTRDKVIELT